MNVTADRTLLIHAPFPAPAARLALKPPDAPAGLLDGAWWPRSHNLLRELPALIAVLDPSWGRITRVSVNPAHWPVVPRKVPVGGHVVKAGWFTEQDPHKLLLLSYRTGRFDLLVVPPGASAAAAARLMAAAAGNGPIRTASALIAEDEAAALTAGAPRVPQERNEPGRDAEAGEREGESERESEWESEGGTAPALSPAPPTRAR